MKGGACGGCSGEAGQREREVKMTSYYDVGTKAWQPDQTEGWVPSEVTKKKVDGDKVKLVFRLGTGEVRITLSMF